MHRNYSKNLKHKEYKIKTGDFIFHLKKRWKVDYYLQLTSILVAILWNMRNPKKKEKKRKENGKKWERKKKTIIGKFCWYYKHRTSSKLTILFLTRYWVVFRDNRIKSQVLQLKHVQRRKFVFKTTPGTKVSCLYGNRGLGYNRNLNARTLSDRKHLLSRNIGTEASFKTSYRWVV